VATDERLRRELDRAARPADPSGIYEHLIRRRERRHIIRKVQTGVLTVAVIVGSIAGVYGLSKVFAPSEPSELGPVTPGAHSNGGLAFTTGDRIVVSSPEGLNQQSVPLPNAGLAWHIAWSPNGDQLAVAIFGDPERSLWVMNADGSDAVLIATADNVGRPSWHPDGEHVTYSAEANGITEVHVARSDGSEDRVVYSEDAPGTYAVFSSTFSPDGSSILFDAGTDSGYDIFVMDADGSNVVRVTRTGTDYNPSWSPDGERIVFTRQEDASESDIFVMDADGSNVVRLTDDGPRFTNLDAQFSPDGTMITYEAAENGGVGPVVLMAADGSDPEVLLKGEVLGFSWQPLPASVVPEPTPGETVVPEPTLTESLSADDTQDVGLGFSVCNVSTVSGAFNTGVSGTAFVETKAGDTGCPRLGDGFQLVAVDVSGDGLADASYGPLECDDWCTAFAAPDVDGDGTDELLIQNIEFSIAGLRLYEVRADPVEVFPVTVATPGYPEGGLDPGAEPQLWIGGDGFNLDELQCATTTGGRVLVQTSANMVPPDTPDSVWKAAETTFALNADGTVSVVGTRTFEEPVEQGGPSFWDFYDGICGARLPYPHGGG